MSINGGLLRILAVAVGAAAMTSGCQQPQLPLDQITVPSDFTFANTRSVTVEIGASQAVLGDTGWAKLEIARPDGQVLYRGPLGANRPVQVHLAVATKDDTLPTTMITSDGGRHQVNVPVAGDTATYTF